MPAHRQRGAVRIVSTDRFDDHLMLAHHCLDRLGRTRTRDIDPGAQNGINLIVQMIEGGKECRVGGGLDDRAVERLILLVRRLF